MSNLLEDWSELRVPSTSVGGETPKTLQEDWNDLGGLPSTAYRVNTYPSFDQFSLWEVRLISRCKPSWLRGSRSGFAVRYEYVRCLWHGPKAILTKPELRQHTSNFDLFDLTLEAAQARLRKHAEDARQTVQSRIEHHASEIRLHTQWLKDQQEALARIQAFDARQIEG